MDLLARIALLATDQLEAIAKRDDASGVLASYRLAELRGVPAPDRETIVVGDGYVIVAKDGQVTRVETESVSYTEKIIREEGGEFCVLSEDGSRSFGCYPTMSEAQDRLRQIHYFDTEKDVIREGTFVSWRSGGGTARGQVEHVMTEGILGIPGSDFEINAEPDDPAALIRIWRESADGWKATETLVGHKVATLTRIDPLTKAKVSVGDHVLFAVPKPPAATTFAHGEVDRIATEGTVTLPGTTESHDASQDDPVAVVTVWAETDTGYTETDRRVVRPSSQLRVSSEPLEKTSAKVMEALKDKAKKHNDSVGDAPSKRTSARTLAAVFDRGVGAYRTNPGSVRPNVSSAEQWAYGRVNGFLHALKTGKFKRTPYDTDLLPKEHALSTKARDMDKESYAPPNDVQAAGKRALAWIAEGHAGSGFTDVGRARAAQLARGEKLSEETIRRMRSFLARHEGDSRAEGFNSGEDGFPSPGRVSWDAWGGDAGKRWADMMVERLDRESDKQECPPATRNVIMNLMHRQEAIDIADYGPLDPSQPNEEYWQRVADVWEMDPEEAKTAVCGNCAAFDITSKMQDCIADGIGDEDPYDVVEAGDLGYCKVFKFKCASARTCTAWIAGGPIADDPIEEVKDLAKATFLKKQAEQRFTLGPLYVPDFMDAHGEWTDASELQAAVWGWVRSGDRRIFLQHDREIEAGEWVEVMTMPQSWTVEMRDAQGEDIGEVTYPPNTVFLGVIWNEEAWELVKGGELRGYSIGGYSDRVFADLPEEASREGIDLPREPVDLAKSIGAAVAEAMRNNQPVVNLVMPENRSTKVRRIERDEHGNIARIIEEDE